MQEKLSGRSREAMNPEKMSVKPGAQVRKGWGDGRKERNDTKGNR